MHPPMSANQRFILALAAIGALTVGLLRTAPAQQPVPKGEKVAGVVNARQFQVVDKNGRVRISLGLEGADDQTTLVKLWNAAGVPAGRLQVDNGKTQIVLAGPDGKHQLALSSTPDGPGLLMGTKKGEQPRLHLLVDEFGEPHVRLFGKQAPSGAGAATR